MASGFPTRPDRDSFGPTKLNASAGIRDLQRQHTAEEINLESHQTAGLGLVSPRVMLRLLVDNAGGSSLISRAEAWNPRGLTTGDQVAPSIASPGVGLLTVTYPTQVADQEGTPVGIAFAWGYGFTSDSPPSVLRHVRVAPTVTPSEFTVGVFDNAGTLVDGETVTVLVW